ncbi:MAG: HupE/UreJ family protein [Pseudomonadota bacterium]
MRRWLRGLLAGLLIAGLVSALADAAWAHPDDEFCMPGQGGIDPALCQALAALDSADGASTLSPAAEELIADLTSRSPWQTFTLYVWIGVQHIVPMGLDHILFVMALVLSTPGLRRLAVQITAFTAAHSATLGLAAAGLVAPPLAMVEPLIAASIAFVALEALLFRDPPPWRLAVVFGFGLVHGLGFAGAFGELGLPAQQFWPGLIGFNVGVEIGQIGVAAATLIALIAARDLGRGAGRSGRDWIVWPAAIAISSTGAFWTVERIWSAF